ncbi:glycoside hydrolase family 3 N-terminal domain-containing protein [Marinigracilibium pacificum]|uniref:beta-N-acetylhexosaminidase n=1 Tax=Marinigracilibium pacificum TaxID=2729599 RepID=A0A848JBA0_9BACT|nr:glycoside hydrolase family 3 N-terminal domain-containing protein [Marinigracilibium pacificum]NMM50302.1 serine hydrolase [Marinigracilibium pacificum]
MSKKFRLYFLLSLLTIFSLKAQDPLAAEDVQAQDKWVDSVFNSLTLEQRIGQLFMIAAYSNKGGDHQKFLDKMVTEYQIGGLITMQGGPGRQIHMLNRLQGEAKVPLLIGSDYEWGLSMRLDSTFTFPKQMTIGALRQNQHVYDMGAEIARQCKAVGVHINFAPVSDINNNPGNPVIGKRAFGEDRVNVALKSMTYMKGLQDNHIIATAKHFPGHGDTDKDSHLTLPVIKHDMFRLDSVELFPFKLLINEGAQGVMVAHLQVPELEASLNTPTTLSKNTVTNLLKEELKFNGLIITDALNMQGVAKFYQPGEVEVKALQAGNDILLFAEDVAIGIKKIVEAINSGDLTEERINYSVKKVLKAKYLVGLNNYTPATTENLDQKLFSAEAIKVRRRIYSGAMTVASNEKGNIPVKQLENTKIASLVVGPSRENTFQRYLSKYAKIDHYQLPKTGRGNTLFNELKTELSKYDVVIVGYHEVSDRKNSNYGIYGDHLELIKSIAKETKVIVTVFGSPYSLGQFEDFENVICTYEDNSMTQEIAPQVIFGAIDAEGRLPVTASPKFKQGTGVKTTSLNRLGFDVPENAGMDSKVLAKIDDIAKEAIHTQATPGCQVLVARKGKIIFEKAYGFMTYDSLTPVTNETVYDIASVTKVVATLQAVMLLHDYGLIDINATLDNYLPELQGKDKGQIVIKDLLSHQAGLKSFIPYWVKTMQDKKLIPELYSERPSQDYPLMVSDKLYGHKSLPDSIWHWTIDSEMRKKKDGKYDYKYSDLTFIFMHRLVESIINQPIEDFLYQNFYTPMGLGTTCYLASTTLNKEIIAPTAFDNNFRNTQIHGLVHDEGAALMGGVAGHAGLFSTAHELAVILQMNLNGGVYGGYRYLRSNTINEFSQPHFEDNRRGLGWDKPAEEEKYSPTSRYCSLKTYGHNGFTGTTVWVDPEFDLVYIFLSNRIYPDASNWTLMRNDIRTRIQDVIYESIFAYEKYKS